MVSGFKVDHVGEWVGSTSRDYGHKVGHYSILPAGSQASKGTYFSRLSTLILVFHKKKKEAKKKKDYDYGLINKVLPL